jgi:hypothetical protein
MSINRRGESETGNADILGGILEHVEHAHDEVGSADYRFDRVTEFASDAIKSGYWAVDIQDARRDLRDAEHAMARAQGRIDSIRAELDKL